MVSVGLSPAGEWVEKAVGSRYLVATRVFQGCVEGFCFLPLQRANLCLGMFFKVGSFE